MDHEVITVNESEMMKGEVQNTLSGITYTRLPPGHGGWVITSPTPIALSITPIYSKVAIATIRSNSAPAEPGMTSITVAMCAPNTNAIDNTGFMAIAQKV